MHGCINPGLIFGFALDEVRLNEEGPFGDCRPGEFIRNNGTYHVVGIPASITMLSKGYISQQARDYGRVIWETLGVKCSFHLTSWFQEGEECARKVTSLRLVKSVKKDWTRKQCENAIKKIAKVTGYKADANECSEEEVYRDYSESVLALLGIPKMPAAKKVKKTKKSTDEIFESYKDSNVVLVPKDEHEEKHEKYVKYDPKEF